MKYQDLASFAIFEGAIEQFASTMADTRIVEIHNDLRKRGCSCLAASVWLILIANIAKAKLYFLAT